MRLFSDAHYGFVEKRKPAYVLSSVVIVIGLAAMVVNLVTLGHWLNQGVDFTGGSMVQVRIDQPGVGDQNVRDALTSVVGTTVTRFAGENEFVIRAPLTEDTDIDDVRATIEGELAAAFGAGSVTVERSYGVGPKIGAELERKAAGAILFSFVLTLIYLAIRFELRFGIAAVIATAHDVV
ncbi:MAG TPA: hypothetical protein VGA70_14445, partial [Longimicrobiales bacterium]